MRKLQPTTQYRKDLKKYKNHPKKIVALKEVLKMLKKGIPIPAEYQPHELHGKYKDCIECHVQGDFLLIWFDANRNLVELVRLGSHSELFK